METEIKKVVELCKNKLDLKNGTLGDEYYYSSLPLCVIDAVFSIGVKYSGTQNVINRFCKHVNIQRLRFQPMPDKSQQLSINNLIQLYSRYGIDGMTDIVYHNKQRTSSRGGILKSEAVYKFAFVLEKFGVDYFQDIDKIYENYLFESKIKQIPGQKSGKSLSYFYMLSGSDDYIKPDRMIERFIRLAIGDKSLTPQECHDIIVGAQCKLVVEYPNITPRLLDYLIWGFQRAQ